MHHLPSLTLEVVAIMVQYREENIVTKQIDTPIQVIKSEM